MKLHRVLIAAVVMTALLFFYLWDKRRVEQQFIEEAADARVFVFAQDQVARVTMRSDLGEFSFERRGGEWWMTSPVEFRAENTAMDALLGNVLGSKRTAQFIPENDTQYGLDNPAATLTLHLAAGNDRLDWAIDFGTSQARMGRVYARVHGEPYAFSVGDWVLNQLRRQRLDWRSRAITSGFSATPQRIRVVSPRGDVEFCRQGEGWELRSGPLHTLADRAIVDRALDVLQNGRFTTMDDAPTSSTTELGFDQPRLRVWIDDALVLTAGRLFEAEKQIAIEQPGGAVGFVPSSMFGDFLRRPAEWSSKRLLWMDEAGFQSLSATSGSTVLQLERTDSGAWQFTGMPDVPINAQRLQSYLSLLAEPLAMQYLGDANDAALLSQYGLERPSLTVVARAAATRESCFGTGAFAGEQSFQIGTSDTREGVTYVRRVQDNTLWAMDITRVGGLYQFRADLEERRIAPTIAARTSKIQVIAGPQTLTVEKRGTTWHFDVDGQRRGVLALVTVEHFLEASSALEWTSELLGREERAATASVRYFAAGETEPFAYFDILGLVGDSGETLLRTNAGNFTASQQALGPLNDTLKLLLRNVSESPQP